MDKMENQILLALKNNKLFSNIPFEELDLTKISGALISLREGEILFREKSKSNFIYLIVSGEINLLIKQKNAKAQSLIFIDNDFLGTEEFIANIPRKSTAVALRDSYLIALSKEEIDILVEQNFDILNNIYATIPENEEDKLAKNNKQEIDENLQTENELPPENDEAVTDISNEPVKSDMNNLNFDLPEISDISHEKESLPVTDDIEQEIVIKSDENIPSELVESIELNETENIATNPEEDSTTKSETPFEQTKTQSVSEPQHIDFSFSERFGLNDSFMNDIQQSENTFADNSDTTNAEKSEEDLSSFYKNDFKFYNESENLPVDEEESKPEEITENQIPEKTNVEPITEKVNTPITIDGELFPTIDHLQKINDAASLVNSNIKIDDILRNIVTVACDLTSADRGTLYFVDKEKSELWSKIAMGSEFREIKLKIGEGIAGWVAKSGEIINLENVREDPRFNASFDKSSGYETKNMICFPIKNTDNEVVGVIQLLNSANGKFRKIDEEFLKALSIHISLAFRNANMVENMLSSERISSLGKMANFLIQDIKKPILVSKRYAEHLKSKNLSEDIVKIVDLLSEQLNHIADLIQSTLSYSEGQIILRSIVRNINEVLDDFIGRIDGYVKSRNCKIGKKFDTNVNVKIAEKQFYHAFEHIIRNACDAMPEGGEIHIETQKSGDNILIMIADGGLGIPESLHEKIFEPFMSLGKREATGLGLSITKKIIEEHGGKISVKSQMGEGATFTISFPIIYSY